MTSTIAKDIVMLKSPDLWPHGAYLPLTRGDTEVGIVFAVADEAVPRMRVYKMSIFDPRRHVYEQGVVPHTEPEFEDYANFEAMVNCGWAVD